MVLKIESPLKDAFFVTSDRPSPSQQRSEVLRWTQTHGYRPYGRDAVFTIYRHGEAVREWRLMLRSKH